MTKNYLEQYDDGNPVCSDEGLTEEQLSELSKLVGDVLCLFNYLESNLERLIANAISNRSHQPGYAVIAELTPVFTKKVTVFKALYGPFIEWSNSDELKTLFTKVVEKLFQIKDVRNELAHANWLEASEKYEVRLKISSDEKGPYSTTKVITPDNLNISVSELESADKLLEEFEELFESEVSS